MSEDELAHKWAEALESGGLKELRRLAARHESLKAAGKTGKFDTAEKPDIIKAD